MLFLFKKQVPLIEIIPNGYVDIHSHLLPGIDDGVKTISQSSYILEKFQKLGIYKVITTPHIMNEVWPNTSLTIKSKLTEMKQTLSALAIDKIELQAGAEYMMDNLFNQRLEEQDILPIHDNYILVEMSAFSPLINLNEILFDIKLAGYSPILAHPERYSYYQDDFKKYDTLKESGFLFQLNLLSLSGYYGEKVMKTAIKLVNMGYIDFTGSDVHNHLQLEILEKGFSSKIAKKITLLMENNIVFT